MKHGPSSLAGNFWGLDLTGNPAPHALLVRSFSMGFLPSPCLFPHSQFSTLAPFTCATFYMGLCVLAGISSVIIILISLVVE